jgi:histidinol phosphatase-like enzyme (inositol monophosphatase family)
MIEIAELRTLLDFAVSIAREAGGITQRYFKGPLHPERKADNSLVTIADRETEQYLRASIEQAFPDDAVLGEEEGTRPGTSKRRWIIDPIDGTYSFVLGVPLYAVLIGLEIDAEPILGVVNLPALDEIVSAGRGLGCFWNGEPARTSSTKSLGDALLLATDFGPGNEGEFGPAIGSLQKEVRARRTWGDAYGHVLVATGRADVMLDPVMNVWDCAALLPILEEAGGTFTDWKGNRTIHGGNAISTNGSLLKDVLARIEQPIGNQQWEIGNAHPSRN